ncbi:restriction endonuclease (plasmid) [Hymenobacter aerilatus]|uniref:Restriction endonuclease n=2 Tax=Hymenobacter TaxID=89966 RepID=A0A8T9T1X1_9BACT|nr:MULTISPECIES: restriction endonuclease [Hymenobacter]MBF9223336.1 restriction endonuclease [Hymenobacter ruricola]UOR07807.1 restriction endonuclease [Hymenobacter aerilatus]
MAEYLYLWLVLLGFLVGLGLLAIRKNRLDKQLAQEKSSLYKDYQTRNSELNVREKILDKRAADVARLEKVLTEKSKSFPWLAGAIADLVLLNNNQVADYLAFKPRPAKSSAQAVREVGKEKRILAAQLKHLQYVINQYEGLFPFLTEFREGEMEEALLEIKDTHGEQAPQEADPVSVFLTAGEYSSLSTTERNQRALERYMQGRKSPYQLGRDYERFVGYLYECEGYTVTYFGIENGKEDLGRDLICRKDGNTLIVQCKYWSKHKLIHEKHINQLFGTTVKFYLDSAQKKLVEQQLHLFPQLLSASNILGVFCTSTDLSDTARKFAQALGIQVREQVRLGAFPMIKCHISPATGERIYHLPFDQMYDRTKLDKAGEFYALTVADAEAKGFRRAWRWRG